MTSTPRQPESLLLLSLRHRFGRRLEILALALGSAVVGVASPVFQKVFIDGLLASDSTRAPHAGVDWLQSVSPLAAITAAALCAFVSQALGFAGGYAATREGTLVQRLFSERLYRKALCLRSDSAKATPTGEVVALYASNVAGASALITQVLPMASFIGFHLVLAPLVIHWVCGIPLWATLSVMGVIISLTLVLAARQSRFLVRFKQLSAERTALVSEWVQSIRLLRVLGWVAGYEKNIFAKREEETRNRLAMVVNGQLIVTFGSSLNFIINLTGIASLIYLSERRVTPGELFMMLWIFGAFLSRAFREIPWLFTFLLESLTWMRGLETFLERHADTRAPEQDEPEAGPLPAGALALSARGLNLTINGKKLLEDVDFEVKPGEFVAIVGEVGCGKSLLLLSLLGETGATFESLRIGSVDALGLDLQARRRHFALVPQEGFVMSASLRENVVFQYEPSLDSDNRVEQALLTCQFRLDDEVHGPGLDTRIGERGVNLSGGQRQRISLARAYHFDRPIVLLDDCLSAVDVDTERRLLEELIEGAWRDRTRILVTHRLSVLERVDRVFLMEDGAISEAGTFADLMKSSRRMRELVTSVSDNTQQSVTGPDVRRADVPAR
ncbi:ATP-binding cassette domain-containing protein [Pyxidicoccus trucidator]|uniref:ATP-binding cassette domain-containing protein n=1 Tax=Pyxidicoccus trucidator TaxID=2709662 RepID=UPI0013DD80DF|nr:ATP-binding cassette domain-containing protein [Pyxidicoccus trucidator]